jgi:hypothetical protein
MQYQPVMEKAVGVSAKIAMHNTLAGFFYLADKISSLGVSR